LSEQKVIYPKVKSYYLPVPKWEIYSHFGVFLKKPQAMVHKEIGDSGSKSVSVKQKKSSS